MGLTHEDIRTSIKWGSYGKNGDESLTERFIKDLSNDHLNNIIIFIGGSHIALWT